MSSALEILTCICLRRRLFRVTLEISRTVINLAYRNIVTSQRGHWQLLTRTRYVCTRVGAGSGRGMGKRKIKAIRWSAYYYSLVLNAQPCKYDMNKSSLRHIYDPVLSSLKMKGIRSLFPRCTIMRPPTQLQVFTNFWQPHQKKMLEPFIILRILQIYNRQTIFCSPSWKWS
jgi:hypothetical protein